MTAWPEWKDIESAPYNTVVRVKAGQMTFLARLIPNGAMSDMDTSCDQWVAEIEGEHPPCWSGGACWENNEDESPSLQPDGWQSLSRQGPDLLEALELADALLRGANMNRGLVERKVTAAIAAAKLPTPPAQAGEGQ
ncbi:hypothetical protein [Novosphingobium olei]|uniref:Uncharacterized protein n=1 Tax=Novosphingobium olei TaxID=2728851 RepID=A0A7Y0GA90_9SPHN|nr:hypothetical protein [Novosphingobium olei]NML93833.1 hypothetical protein [Novosphingobium olei]